MGHGSKSDPVLEAAKGTNHYHTPFTNSTNNTFWSFTGGLFKEFLEIDEGLVHCLKFVSKGMAFGAIAGGTLMTLSKRGSPFGRKLAQMAANDLRSAIRLSFEQISPQIAAGGVASFIFWLIHYNVSPSWFSNNEIARWRASFGTSAMLAAGILGSRRLMLLALFTGVFCGEHAYRMTHPLPVRSGFYIQLPGLTEEQRKTYKLEDLIEEVGNDHAEMVSDKDWKQL